MKVYELRRGDEQEDGRVRDRDNGVGSLGAGDLEAGDRMSHTIYRDREVEAKFKGSNTFAGMVTMEAALDNRTVEELELGEALGRFAQKLIKQHGGSNVIGVSFHSVAFSFELEG